MKKLGKLTINPEKVIKNEELVNLRGGYGGGGHWASCKDSNGDTICGGEVPSCDSQVVSDYCNDNCPCTTSSACA